MGTTTVRSDIERGTEAAFTTYLGDRDIKVTATIEQAVTNALGRWLNQHETQVLASAGLRQQPTDAERQHRRRLRQRNARHHPRPDARQAHQDPRRPHP